MKYSQKAQISLVKSVLLYGAKAFVLIYGLLLIFFSLSEITTALIKSRSFGVDFMIFVKPMLILLPTLLSVAVPYVFLITLFLVIRKLKQNNFFQFTTIYPTVLRYLISAGLLISIFFSAAIFSLQENVLNKFDKYIENEIKNIGSRPISTIIEPLSFNYFGDYVFYLPTIPDETKKHQRLYGNVYRLKNRKMNFAGRGFLVRNQAGNIFLDNVWGIEFDSKGMAKKKIAGLQIPLLKNKIAEKEIKKYVAYYKSFFSKPNIPLTTRGHKLGYPFPEMLEKINIFQSILFILSPLIIYLFLLMVYFLINKPLFVESCHYFYSFLAFIWSVLYLIFPLLTNVSYNQKPTFFWFWMILFSGIFVMILIAQKKISNVSSIILRKLIDKKSSLDSNDNKDTNTYKDIQKIGYSQSILISPFIRSKGHFILLHSKIFFSWILVVYILLFSINSIYRLLINWKLNKSMEDFYWFMKIQLYDFPEQILSLSPYYLVLIIPIMLNDIAENKIFKRLDLSGNNSLKVIIWINAFGLFFLLISFILRENFAYEWKKNANKLHREYVHGISKVSTMNKLISRSEFISLPNDKIFFYHTARKSQNKYYLSSVALDSITNEKTIITAKSAYVKKNNLILKHANTIDVTLFKSLRNAKGKNTFMKNRQSIKKILINKNFLEYLSTKGIAKFMSTFQLQRDITLKKYYNIQILKLRKVAFLQRILPFFMVPIFLFFYVCFLRLFDIQITLQTMTLSAICCFLCFAGLNNFLIFVYSC